MTRATLYCIVEGHTENAVLKALLAPHLGARGVDLHVPIVRSARGRGGVKFLDADHLYDQIRRFLQDRRQPYVTTLFDYYAFPTGESRGWEFAPRTAPSKRIERAFPGYIKGRSDYAHGPRIAQRLDLDNVRARCPRFDAWLAKLEVL